MGQATPHRHGQVGATDLATRMVREFGMSQALGPVGFAELLLERETADGTDVDGVLGRIPGQHQPIGATGHTSTTTKEQATARGR